MLEVLTNVDLWITGGTTMLCGMGVVFIFLIILVFAISIMTKCVALIDKIWPAPIEEVKTAKKAKVNDESEIALAVVLAHKGI